MFQPAARAGPEKAEGKTGIKRFNKGEIIGGVVGKGLIDKKDKFVRQLLLRPLGDDIPCVLLNTTDVPGNKRAGIKHNDHARLLKLRLMDYTLFGRLRAGKG